MQNPAKTDQIIDNFNFTLFNLVIKNNTSLKEWDICKENIS